MYILGLNIYHGDSSACIFKDGELICAFEEERFTRIKHWAGFPTIAIKECLKEAGIDLETVEHITISRNPKEHFVKKLLHILKYQVDFKGVIQRFKNSNKAASVESDFEKHFSIPKAEFNGKIYRIEHHRSHLASAFFASPFQEAAVLSVDAFGDFCSTMLALGQDNQITVKESVLFPHSIGMFYTAFTQYLGFLHYGDEYKIMGAAPYGKPTYLKELENILQLTSNGLFKLNLSFFNHHTKGVTTNIFESNDPTPSIVYSNQFENVFGIPRNKDGELTDKHRNLAASVQRHCENSIFHVLRHLYETTKVDKLCLAGGVAQNSVANGKITSNTPFKKVYIPPAGHDAGTSIGSALYLYNHILKQPRQNPMYNPYTGSYSTNVEIERLMSKRQISYKRLEDIEIDDTVTDCIIDGGVVGWFSGRAEFGPRALGARSILADPRNPKAKDLLNLKIKRRESFRPFAPSILKEYTGEYFTKTDEVPFMEKVFPIREEKRALIPAVCHVDGSGRLQTVDKNVAPRYYALIERFRQKTGIPILLNTSFNENEPIVNTPEEALNCYLRTQMDMLVLENCVIVRG